MLFAACSETDKMDEYHDWQSRNTGFIDSIAHATALDSERGVTVENAEVGDMFRILSYKLDSSQSGWDISDYVYCKVLRKGNGIGSPLYSDSIKINFRGALIPTPEHPAGLVFQQTYKSDLPDDATCTPSGFILSELVCGMITGIQQMKEGDVWRLYIPSELGYHTKEKSIPLYSTLIFDVNLVRFTTPGD